MPETILVIEDERMTRTNLLGFLRSEGYESLGAANGKEGIQLAQRHLPDLIICDILMPELDGYDVLMTLQKNPQTASIPFIFLTVAADEDGFRHGLSLGADDYLSKPVTSKQLGAAITAQLKKKLKNSDLPLPVTSSADWVPHQ
ncbi:MAG: response regulator [Phormidesmis sp. RL_2_1]|nr:response regulator [Phormidesmis sp. RL_2_1]